MRLPIARLTKDSRHSLCFETLGKWHPQRDPTLLCSWSDGLLPAWTPRDPLVFPMDPNRRRLATCSSLARAQPSGKEAAPPGSPPRVTVCTCCCSPPDPDPGAKPKRLLLGDQTSAGGRLGQRVEHVGTERPSQSAAPGGAGRGSLRGRQGMPTGPALGWAVPRHRVSGVRGPARRRGLLSPVAVRPDGKNAGLGAGKPGSDPVALHAVTGS